MRRWAIFKERYDSFDGGPGIVTVSHDLLASDPNIPRFHYGSHYSSAGIALYYLVRLEPFTSLAVGLQGGHLDLPDRLFDSISSAWDLSFNNISDVKVYLCLPLLLSGSCPSALQELIPEFFYLADIFRNVNRLDMGTKQDGTRLVQRLTLCLFVSHLRRGVVRAMSSCPSGLPLQRTLSESTATRSVLAIDQVVLK